jgi:NTP pyrophosphatase (non-canonical NTP hydrolase)
MIIRCETQNDYDRFYIPDKNSLDELKEYAENNMPIKCYKLGCRSKYSIYLEEELKEVYLYLNNYLHYYNVLGYLMTEDEYEKIQEEQCKKCKNYSYNWGCNNCYEKSKNDICLNFEEEIVVTFKQWIKNKIGIK